MSKKRKNIAKICLAAFVLLGGLIWALASLSQPVSAMDGDTVYKKALLNGIRKCYNPTYMMVDDVPGNDFSSVFKAAGKKDGIVRVPTVVGNTLNDSDLSCYEIFFGYPDNNTSSTKNNSARGLFALYGKSATEITNLGYELDNQMAGNDEKCVLINYEDTSVVRQIVAEESGTIKK